MFARQTASAVAQPGDPALLEFTVRRAFARDRLDRGEAGGQQSFERRIRAPDRRQTDMGIAVILRERWMETQPYLHRPPPRMGCQPVGQCLGCGSELRI